MLVCELQKQVYELQVLVCELQVLVYKAIAFILLSIYNVAGRGKALPIGVNFS
ncbi:hypothetical protein IQ278_19350 [Tolypothrix sp. LEGE 11397]|uniref:hypothetical protein n=1 Tax=unclassified Tolypothrix TaxID=2649714 RepID=UPI0012D84BAF|nr:MULTISPECIES: hypothetical protein [unclassified Tolypothrix]MBE9084265.1 hypothetical protein [Tolypothrix sp. LEGE 11397]UYD24558.1 hypothetical protein HGR01_24390 [Tolypothrix sp. PCC 7712]UYD33213.1 hypothetical protein HG267_30280 [Tolypothrix sp. PCC 7601]